MLFRRKLYCGEMRIIAQSVSICLEYVKRQISDFVVHVDRQCDGNKIGIHPVYAIKLMAEDLAEKLEQKDKEYWTDALEEVKKDES